MEEKYYITRVGYQRFVERMKAAAQQYEAYAAKSESAAEAGDNSVWHDNFAYEQNQRDLHQWAKTFRDLQAARERMVLVEIDPSPDEVKIGCEVVVQDTTDGTRKAYKIVGYEDGDPMYRRISYSTPLAEALMGARVGNICDYTIGKKRCEVEIVEIRPLEEA